MKQNVTWEGNLEKKFDSMITKVLLLQHVQWNSFTEDEKEIK